MGRLAGPGEEGGGWGHGWGLVEHTAEGPVAVGVPDVE